MNKRIPVTQAPETWTAIEDRVDKSWTSCLWKTLCLCIQNLATPHHLHLVQAPLHVLPGLLQWPHPWSPGFHNYPSVAHSQCNNIAILLHSFWNKLTCVVPLFRTLQWSPKSLKVTGKVSTWLYLFGHSYLYDWTPRWFNGKESACQCRRLRRHWSLGQEGPLKKEMATHSSVLARKIPWTEEPGRLQSVGLQRVRHDWAYTHNLYNHISYSSLLLSSNHIDLLIAPRIPSFKLATPSWLNLWSFPR